MTGIWRYLFRDNPMQIETLRAVRRFSVTQGRTATIQRTVARTLIGLLGVLYFWFLYVIASYGEDISMGIFWFEFVLLTLLIPGALYQAISGERERLTWDSLILTNLSPMRILTGKLLWRLGMAAGILLLFLPPLLLTHSVTRFSTSYTLGNMLWLQTILAAWCVFLATFTLWISARTKRSVVTLSIVTVFLLSTLLLGPALSLLFGGKDILSQPIYINRGQGTFFSLNAGTSPFSEYSPMQFFGSLLIHLNPGYIIHALDNEVLRNTPSDFWRDFWAPARNAVAGDIGVGIFSWLPLIYLGFAALCLNRTLKALARLGLPGGATK
jgi:hypothetical protein